MPIRICEAVKTRLDAITFFEQNVVSLLIKPTLRSANFGDFALPGGGGGGRPPPGAVLKFQTNISSKIFHDSSQSLLENSCTVAMIRLRPFISTSFPVHYFVSIFLLGT
jgi:hypothetical protein